MLILFILAPIIGLAEEKKEIKLTDAQLLQLIIVDRELDKAKDQAEIWRLKIVEAQVKFESILRSIKDSYKLEGEWVIKNDRLVPVKPDIVPKEAESP